MSVNIFISYSSVDTDSAFRLVKYLEENRHSCWIAKRDEIPGRNYVGPIMEALKQARILLLVLTQAAADSDDVYNEVSQAKGKILIPVWLEPVDLQARMNYFIKHIHWFDAQQGLTEYSLARILDLVNNHLAVKVQPRNTDEVTQLTNRALAGDVESQFALARHFKSVNNHTDAVTWLRKSAEKGHPEGTYQFALHLRSGVGVLRNEDAAFSEFAQAARLGHREAQTTYATALLHGIRGTPDPQQALEWFERAAAAGSVEAQFEVAQLLDNGRAGIRDWPRAIEQLERAAPSGHTGSQFLLAKLLFEGKGRSQDLAQARHWAQVAADQGHLQARTLLTRIIAAQKTQS